MPKRLKRKPQKFTVDEYLSGDAGLPGKLELVDGMIGPFRDAGRLTMLANWGADAIIKLTGPQIWIEALAARGDIAAPAKPPRK